jgi:hypothetical protein
MTFRRQSLVYKYRIFLLLTSDVFQLKLLTYFNVDSSWFNFLSRNELNWTDVDSISLLWICCSEWTVLNVQVENTGKRKWPPHPSIALYSFLVHKRWNWNIHYAMKLLLTVFIGGPEKNHGYGKTVDAGACIRYDLFRKRGNLTTDTGKRYIREQ